MTKGEICERLKDILNDIDEEDTHALYYVAKDIESLISDIEKETDK
jgi:hypothetical protein